MGWVVFTVVVAMAFGLPLVAYICFLVENARSRSLGEVCRLCGGRLAWPLVCALLDAVASIVLVMLSLPLGFFPAPRRGRSRSDMPPVVLVHGLYHNGAAWAVFRHRLAVRGFSQILTYSYPSFRRPFAAIVEGLVKAVQKAAREAENGQVLLVGHSLGGLVIRAALADARLVQRVAGVVTLGSPHAGSTLADLAGMGRLARSLGPKGVVVQQVNAATDEGSVCVPKLSLATPLDDMVLPLSGARLRPQDLECGWREELTAPVSHVGLLFDKATAKTAIDFLLSCVGRA